VPARSEPVQAVTALGPLGQHHLGEFVLETEHLDDGCAAGHRLRLRPPPRRSASYGGAATGLGLECPGVLTPELDDRITEIIAKPPGSPTRDG